jgi:hypothetical protein
MSVDRRITALERELQDRGGSQEGVVIKVLRIPSDGPEDERLARATVSKMVELDGRGTILGITNYDN